MIVFNASCSSSPVKLDPISKTQKEKEVQTIAAYKRPEDSTYLTYPEWYIVYSSQEYAKFIQGNHPSKFPYYGEIGQFWGGYCQVYGLTKNRYELNFDDHLMIGVIGTSITTEYVLKGIYERSIGVMTEWNYSEKNSVAEDKYAYKVAYDYGQFITIRPWYEYNFWESFTGLWKETNVAELHIERKAERRMILSIEYLGKAIYGGLMKLATQSAYGSAGTDTYAILENTTEANLKQYKSIKIIKKLSDKKFIVIIPRYQEFTPIAQTLALQKVKFVDIAGNDEILLTAVAPRTWENKMKNAQVVFSREILTDQKSKRVGIRMPVTLMAEVLNTLDNEKVFVEHIYDY